jgi:TetR/AcrR family transcriptional regulator
VARQTDKRLLAIRKAPPRKPTSEAQRLAILIAMARLSYEQGVRSTTVAEITERAGVSRRRFHRMFKDRDDCFRATLELAVARAAQSAGAAGANEAGWENRVRAGIRGVLAYFDRERDLAWLSVVDALGADGATLARRGEVLEKLAEIVREGRTVMAPTRQPPLSAEGAVDTVFAVMHGRLSRAQPSTLGDLAEPLMNIIRLSTTGVQAGDGPVAEGTAGGDGFDTASANERKRMRRWHSRS